MKSTLTLIAVLILTSCGDNDDQSNQVSQLPSTPDTFEVTTVDELRNQLSDGYVEAMNKTNMTIGFVNLVQGEISSRPQTTFDEVFYVFDGSGEITIGDTKLNIQKGETIMVQGTLDTKLHTDSNVEVIVTTMKENGLSVPTGFKHFSVDQITEMKSVSRNSWNQFLKEINVSFGLYSLPQTIGGDQTLTHTWEELNIITTGSSQFAMGNETIEIRRGTIVFVENGIGHFFSQLKSDVDIMILWEQ